MRLVRSLVLLMLLFVSSAAALAQDYPSRPITMIVPFSAGGPGDVIARILGTAMSAPLKQAFVIENVVGEPVDLALCVGLAFSAMDRFAPAMDFLELSVKEHPDSAPAAFAMAVARRGLRDLRAASEWAQRALDLEPGFPQARALRAVLTEELATNRGC